MEKDSEFKQLKMKGRRYSVLALDKKKLKSDNPSLTIYKNKINRKLYHFKMSLATLCNFLQLNSTYYLTALEFPISAKSE